jgi:phage tail sheath protein FI
MLILDPPMSWDSPAAAMEGVRHAGYASPDIMTYFPRVVPRHEQEVEPAVIGGAFAGLLCKLDRLHGPWQDLDQHGLGLNRRLRPACSVGVDYARLLVREGVNVIAGQVAGCAMICGSVTLGHGSQMDRKFSGMTVRRLCLRITNALERATRWAVFEPAGRRVAERIHGQADGYMSYLANAGAFANDRFVVHCETALNTSALDPSRGVNIVLAFRPVGTDEDVTLTLHQTIAGCRVAVTAFAPAAAEVA